MVPVPLAWLGVFTSVLLVVWLPLQLVGFFEGWLNGVYQWVPVFLFQVALALWLLIKGVAPSALSQPV
jgi:purine-cytosine permease-like protein